MVNARLHIICGNCGSDNDWHWEIEEQEMLGDEVINNEDVHIICRNCCTIHSLNSKARKVGT